MQVGSYRRDQKNSRGEVRVRGRGVTIKQNSLCRSPERLDRPGVHLRGGCSVREVLLYRIRWSIICIHRRPIIENIYSAFSYYRTISGEIVSSPLKSENPFSSVITLIVFHYNGHHSNSFQQKQTHFSYIFRIVNGTRNHDYFNFVPLSHLSSSCLSLLKSRENNARFRRFKLVRIPPTATTGFWYFRQLMYCKA